MWYWFGWMEFRPELAQQYETPPLPSSSLCKSLPESVSADVPRGKACHGFANWLACLASTDHSLRGLRIARSAGPNRAVKWAGAASLPAIIDQRPGRRGLGVASSSGTKRPPRWPLKRLRAGCAQLCHVAAVACVCSPGRFPRQLRGRAGPSGSGGHSATRLAQRLRTAAALPAGNARRARRSPPPDDDLISPTAASRRSI